MLDEARVQQTREEQTMAALFFMITVLYVATGSICAIEYTDESDPLGFIADEFKSEINVDEDLFRELTNATEDIAPSPPILNNSSDDLVQPKGLYCRELKSGDRVKFRSKYYPYHYPRYHRKVRCFKAPRGMTLSVACGHSYIIPTYHCHYDYLYFCDFGSFRKKYCGSITINFTTEYNGLIAAFKSNYYRTAKGFLCYIWVTATTSTTTSTTESTTTSTTTSTTESTTTSTTTSTTESSTTSTTTSTTESTSSSSTLPTASPRCSCGKVNRGTRIVGGHETEINEYPWQVGLVKNSSNVLSPFCGGSIIDEYHILTAAHCVDSRNAGDINVVVGDHHTGNTDETNVTKRISVESITIHKDYDSSTLDNDIAIIKLAEPIEFQSDNRIAPVCLPDAKTDYSNVEAIVSGWGALSSGGSSPDSLHEVAVTTLTNDACSESYSSLTDNMICAGDPNGGKDSCQGDSGGPLVTSNGGSMQLIGIVSWGRGCALKDYPGVYTSVQKYLSWINDVTGGICTP